MEQTDNPGTETGQQTSGAAPEQQTPPADSGGRTYTQTDVDGIAAKARREAEARAKAAEAKLAELEAAEEKRKQAEMTELERAQAEAAQAKTEAEEARARAAASALAAERATLLAAEGQGLPMAYQAMVIGDNADAIRASLGKAREQYDADRKAWLGQLATMTPEQVAAMDTDEAKALAARLAGKPASIGAPSNAGAAGSQPPPPSEWDDNDPATHTPENWRKERERRGFRNIR